MRFFCASAGLLTILALPCSAVAAPARVDDLTGTVLTGKVAYVKIERLSGTVTAGARTMIDGLARLKPTGMIVDLRRNTGGDIAAVHAVLSSFLPQRTPYMKISTEHLRLAVTSEPPVYRRSQPVVVLIDERTGNEAMIIAYVLQQIRKATVIREGQSYTASLSEFPTRGRMRDYSPIKESSFHVIPDIRTVHERRRLPTGDRDGTIVRALAQIKELAPWALTK